MKFLFKVLAQKNRELTERSRTFVASCQFGADATLFSAVSIMLLAAAGLAGVVWRELGVLLRAAGLTVAAIVAPAILWAGISDLLKLGWNWKYVAALICSLVAMALVALGFHEILSVTPFFRRF